MKEPDQSEFRGLESSLELGWKSWASCEEECDERLTPCTGRRVGENDGSESRGPRQKKKSHRLGMRFVTDPP